MTSNGQAVYEKKVGNLDLTAYSLDPRKGVDDLVRLVQLRETPINLSQAAQQRPVIAEFGSIDELTLNILGGRYEVPEQFRDLRQRIEKSLIQEGKTNGPIIIVRDPINIPLKVKQGGYFDFQATSAEKEEVRDIMQRYGTPVTDLARYLGFGYFVTSGDGKEILGVHRSQDVGIVKNVMSLNGSTPAFDNGFYDPGFDFKGYFTRHIEDRMKTDFGLEKDKYSIGRGIFMDEKDGNNPIIVWEIQTPLSAKEIAGRVNGNEYVIRKHPIIYALSNNGVYDDVIGSLVQLPMYPQTAHVVDTFVKPR